MSNINLTINDQPVKAPNGTTVLEAARSAEIYIPTLCSHPDLPVAKNLQPAEIVYQGKRTLKNALPETVTEGCGLCVVEVEGMPDLVESCNTLVENDMIITTENDRIKTTRQENLTPILTRHPHTCLTCAQQEGCSLTQCSSNVPENEWCCPLFGHCELQNVANYVGISDSTPRWLLTDLPVFKGDPLFERDYNLCIGCTRCIRACRDLKSVEALNFVYDENGNIQVGTVKPSLEESGCKFCTVCVEVCPTGALMDKAVRPGKKEEDIVPCREACPAHIDTPEYLKLIAEGKRDKANVVIREKVPFPGILGRVCAHPCEDVCRRGEVNESISICALKRYVADGDDELWKKLSQAKTDTGKKVAVVGAGPAGLTAAFYLRKQGYSVVIFEARKKAGGMMRYGIPAYRLPRDVLDKEIKDILSLGVDFKPGHRLGRDITLGQLMSDGYDAVFLAMGAQLSHRITIEGSDSPDVKWGIDFLAKVAEAKEITLKNRIIVIGGGDVAVDAAMSARRCGAKEVTMVCLESRDEMPAHSWEIENALAEGVKLKPSWGPHKILRENGQINGVELVQCTRVFDDQGIFSPTFGDNHKIIEGDQVIFAIGQTTDLSFLENGSPVSVNNGLIVVNEDILETGQEGIYAGGDITTMSGTIIDAIVAGRKAATSIDKSLGGTGDIDEILFKRNTPNQHLGRDENFALWQREEIPELEPKARRQGFSEISLGYDAEQAVREAKRCLQCDLRLAVKSNPSPPAKWLMFNEEMINQVPVTEGVFQLLDDNNNVLAICGTANLRELLLEELSKNENATRFEYEENKMYSQRESELIQQYLQQYGEMPGGGDSDLDDLF